MLQRTNPTKNNNTRSKRVRKRQSHQHMGSDRKNMGKQSQKVIQTDGKKDRTDKHIAALNRVFKYIVHLFLDSAKNDK